MRRLEFILSSSDKSLKKDWGEPLVKKSDEDIVSINPEKLREVYVKDPVTFNGINKMVQLILSAEHRLTTTALDIFLNNVGDIGTPTTWNEITENIFRHSFVYGSSWIELIPDIKTGKIIDLVSVNPERMDYARDSRGTIVVDEYSRPVGYTHKLPTGVTVPKQQNVPPKVKLDSYTLFIPPERMAKIDLFLAGDGLKSYGLIEPSYSSIRRRLELEEAYATALDKALPVRIGKYGDQFNRPTPQKMQTFLEKLVNLRGKTDSLVVPYHSDVKLLESTGVQNLLEPIKYYLTLGLAGFGLPMPFAVGIGEECYSEDTLTLTEDGFKYYWEIKDDDKIATFNPETNKIEYHTPLFRKVHNYSGKMHHYKSSVMDILVTPAHKIYYRRENGKEWSLTESEKITKNRFRFRNNVDYYGNENEIFTLPECRYDEQSRKENHGELKIKMDDWLEFLGYFISEGWVSINSGFSIEISQIQPEKIEKIRNCLNRLPFKFNEKHSRGRLEGFRMSDKSLAIFLREHIGHYSYDVHIPKEYRNLSKRQMEILLDALLLGDGSRFGTTGILYYTASDKLRDDVAEIMMKLGYAVSIKKNKNVHRISGNKTHLDIRVRMDKHRTLEDYNGVVYCFEVPNHLFITMRNGKIAIQGNTNRATLGVQADVYRKTLQQIVFRITDQIERKIFKPVMETNELPISRMPKFKWEQIVFEKQSEGPA